MTQEANQENIDQDIPSKKSFFKKPVKDPSTVPIKKRHAHNHVDTGKNQGHGKRKKIGGHHQLQA